MASINGFSVVKFGDSGLSKFTVPGTNARLSLRKEIAPLLLGLARDFHRTVEQLKPKSCWGHDHRKVSGSNSWSFHAPGIAIDLNASDHPRGVKNTFGNDEVRAIRKLLTDYSYHGVKLFRWGADFSTTVDDMHFEIIVPRGTALAAVKALGQPVPAGTGPGSTAHAPGSRELRATDPAMQGRDVEYVQQWIGERRCGPADGFFGSKSRAGVRWYQGLRGIDVTGVCDRVTWRNMRIRPTF
jgi:peptidoglycan hydrolase-like protein with peptidoglycan-binding domain